MLTGCLVTSEPLVEIGGIKEISGSAEVVYFENFPGVEDITCYLGLDKDSVTVLYEAEGRLIFCFPYKDFHDADAHDRTAVSYYSYVWNLVDDGFKWELYDATYTSTFVLENGEYIIRMTIGDMEIYKEALIESGENILFDTDKLCGNILFDIAFINE